MLLAIEELALLLLGRLVIRVVEESELSLELKHSHNASVKLVLAEHALVDKLVQVLIVSARHHLYVTFVSERHLGTLLKAARNSVVHKLAQSRVVAHDKSVVAPLFAKDLLHYPRICSCGNAAEIVERGHYELCARIYARLVGGEIELAKDMLGELHRVVISPALSAAVSRQMLDACGYISLL